MSDVTSTVGLHCYYSVDRISSLSISESLAVSRLGHLYPWLAMAYGIPSLQEW